MARTQIARTDVFSDLGSTDAVDVVLRVDDTEIATVRHDATEQSELASNGFFALPRGAKTLTIAGSARLDRDEFAIDQTQAIADLGVITGHLHDAGASLIDRLKAMDAAIAPFRNEEDDSSGLFRAEFIGPVQDADLKRTEAEIGHAYPQALYDVLSFRYGGWGVELFYPDLKWAQPYTVMDWLRYFDTPEKTLADLGIYGRLYERSFGTVHWDTHGGNLRVLGWLPGGLERIESYQFGHSPDQLGPMPEGFWFSAFDDDQWRPDLMVRPDGRAMSAQEAMLSLIQDQVIAQVDELAYYGALGDVPEKHVVMDSANPAGRLTVWLSEDDGGRAVVRITQR